MNESVDPHAKVVALKHIPVSIDRSGYKEKISGYAISLGKAWGADLMGIDVMEPRYVLPDDSVEAESKEQAREKEAKNRLNNYLMKLIFWQRKKA